MTSTMTSERINDFALKIATVNCTGSASANTLLMKSIFRSGIPVMGKNYFPSNIQGFADVVRDPGISRWLCGSFRASGSHGVHERRDLLPRHS